MDNEAMKNYYRKLDINILKEAIHKIDEQLISHKFNNKIQNRK